MSEDIRREGGAEISSGGAAAVGMYYQAPQNVVTHQSTEEKTL